MNKGHPEKVLILTSSYPRYSDDSASIFLRHFAENLHKLGITIHVLAPADKRLKTESGNGIIVHHFRYFPSRWQKLAYGSGILSNLKRNPFLWLQAPFFLIAMLISLLRLIRTIQPDIIHAHWVIPQGFIATLSKFFHKIPVLITVHGADTFALKNRMAEKIKRFSLAHCDAWTSNTFATAHAISYYDSLPAPHIIPMGIDIENFGAGDRQKLRAEISNNTFIILFVGRLVEKKGIDDLIIAFSLLPHEIRRNSRLWIVGDGYQREMLDTLVHQYKLEDMVTFWGKVPNNCLPDYYAAADLFVGPSVISESGDTEGQGVVFLEAAGAKLCILTTDVGGISEVIENGKTGILVRPRDPKDLARNMEKLLTDHNLRKTLASNAYYKLIKYYSWDKIALDFKNLYQQLANS